MTLSGHVTRLIFRLPLLSPLLLLLPAKMQVLLACLVLKAPKVPMAKLVSRRVLLCMAKHL
jgi:hypothetical protein